MGLDVYAGTLTRYYSDDWETVWARRAREAGAEVMNASDRSAVEDELQRRWSSSDEDWRSYNLDRVRAQEAVRSSL